MSYAPFASGTVLGERSDFVPLDTETKCTLLNSDLNAADFQSRNPSKVLYHRYHKGDFPWPWASGLMSEIHMGHKEMFPSTQYRKLEERCFHSNHTRWINHSRFIPGEFNPRLIAL